MVKNLAAIATPFAADGRPDLDAFGAHLDWLCEAGLDGVFVAGTTGEGVLLEQDEVAALVEQAVAADGSLRVIAQVGRPSTRATVAARPPGTGLRGARRRGLRAVVLSGHPGPAAPPFPGAAGGGGRRASVHVQHPAAHRERSRPGPGRRTGRAGFAGMNDSTGDFARHEAYLRAVDGRDFELYTAPSRCSCGRCVPARPARSARCWNCAPELFTGLRTPWHGDEDTAARLQDEITTLKEQRRPRSRPSWPSSAACGSGSPSAASTIPPARALRSREPRRHRRRDDGAARSRRGRRDRPRRPAAPADRRRRSNFAVGLARLGVSVAWISRLGADRLGALVRAALEGEGVDLRWVAEDREAPTGLFYKWRDAGRTSVAYYRRARRRAA